MISTRRLAVAVAVAALLLGTAVGCGEDADEPAVERRAPGEKITLEFWSWVTAAQELTIDDLESQGLPVATE